jgi:flagellar basal-body rod protein FlgB
MDIANTMLVLKVLDGLSARAVATAQNIANAGTPSYRPLRVTFETALREAAAQGADAVSASTAEVEYVSSSDPQDQELRLDLELATASMTAMRYSALIDMLNRQMQLKLLAIKGNN